MNLHYRITDTYCTGLTLPQETTKSIRNPRNTNWSKFRSELEDKLSYYNGFRVESKDDLEMMMVFLNTSIREFFV